MIARKDLPEGTVEQMRAHLETLIEKTAVKTEILDGLGFGLDANTIQMARIVTFLDVLEAEFIPEKTILQMKILHQRNLLKASESAVTNAQRANGPQLVKPARPSGLIGPNGQRLS